MKKKLGDLTLREIGEICKKYHPACISLRCPGANHLRCRFKTYKKEDLDREIEVPNETVRDKIDKHGLDIKESIQIEDGAGIIGCGPGVNR